MRTVSFSTVTLATKDETSRGVAKACLLSVADVGTILQVVVKPRKPRWRLTVFIQIDKDEDDHKDDHDRKLKLQ